MYIKPSLVQRKEQLIKDEWWQIAIILFALRVYSNYALKQAVGSCERRGGIAEVTSKFFGSSWEVKCIKK